MILSSSSISSSCSAIISIAALVSRGSSCSSLLSLRRLTLSTRSSTVGGSFSTSTSFLTSTSSGSFFAKSLPSFFLRKNPKRFFAASCFACSFSSDSLRALKAFIASSSTTGSIGSPSLLRCFLPIFSPPFLSFLSKLSLALSPALASATNAR